VSYSGEIEGDELEQKVSDDEFNAIRQEYDEEVGMSSSGVVLSHQEAGDIRFCRWTGQSKDGRKHSKDLGKDALPFEGASDVRHMLADKIVNECVNDVVLATRRAFDAKSVVHGVGEEDTEVASRGQQLLRWVVNSKWKKNWPVELELAAQYSFGDSPGACIFHVDFVERKGIKVERLDATSFGQQVISLIQSQNPDRPITDDELDLVMGMINDPAQIDSLKNLISAMFPNLRPRRVTKMARSFYEDGIMEFPMPVTVYAGPEITACRLREDIVIPSNTTSIQTARWISRRWWYPRADILAMAATEGWSDEFVQKVAPDDGEGQEGMSSSPGMDNEVGTRVLQNATERHDGLYEIIETYCRKADEYGSVGVYVYTWNHGAGMAKPRVLFARDHGGYPFVAVTRENRNRLLIESRGIPELAMSEQEIGKIIRDSFIDHVQRNTNPPVTNMPGGPGGTGLPKYATSLAPNAVLGRVQGGREPGYIVPPPYPSAAEAMLEECRKEISEYFARADGLAEEGIITPARQMRVNRFLDSIVEVLDMTLSLALEFYPPEVLFAVAGLRPEHVEQLKQGYDNTLQYKVESFDSEYLLRKIEVLKSIQGFDPKGLMPYGEFVRSLISDIDPNWGAMIPTAGANAARVTEETTQTFANLVAGVEPMYPPDIEDPETRMRIVTELYMARMNNPGAYGPLSPASVAMIENYMKYLNFQIEQNQNANIGRTGVEPVVPESLPGESVPQEMAVS
jgi:hypothetical protein